MESSERASDLYKKERERVCCYSQSGDDNKARYTRETIMKGLLICLLVIVAGRNYIISENYLECSFSLRFTSVIKFCFQDLIGI